MKEKKTYGHLNWHEAFEKNQYSFMITKDLSNLKRNRKELSQQEKNNENFMSNIIMVEDEMFSLRSEIR